MTQHYSDPAREPDPYALPDVEVFQLTAEEVASLPSWEDEHNELVKRREFRLASMNPKVAERMIETMIQECGITGGWFYQFGFPGCLPDSDPIGPFASREEALADMREQYGEGEE